MNQFFHIIFYKILSFIKLNKVRNIYDFLKSTGTTLVYFLFAVGAFYFTKSVINYLLVQVKIGIFLLHEFASMIFFIFFLTVNAGNIIVSYSTLYKSSEVGFLLSKPVNPGKLFIIKFLDNFFYSSSTLLVVLFAVIAGYAAYFHFNIMTVASIILLNFLPFMFSAASLGVIILILIIKAASKYGFKPVILVIVLLYLSTIFIFFNTISPVTLVNDVFKHYPHIDHYFGDLIPAFIKLLPNNWLSESLYWIIRGQYIKATPFFIYQILLSSGLFSFAMYLGNKWYYTTWLLMPGLFSSGKRKRAFFSIPVSFEKRSFFNTQTEAIIKKDILLFLREPSQVIHFSLLLLMILLFMLSVSKLTNISASNAYLQTIIYISIFIFNVLLISTLSLRFIFPIVSLEGQAFWKAKTAPLLIRKFIRVKLSVFAIVIFFMSIMLCIFSNRRYPEEIITFSAILIIFVSAALISMNFGLGCMFANYNEKNPIRISSSQGASLSFLLCIFYMIFLILILFPSVNQYFTGQINSTVIGFSGFAKPVTIIGCTSTIIIILSYILSVKALKKDF